MGSALSLSSLSQSGAGKRSRKVSKYLKILGVTEKVGEIDWTTLKLLVKAFEIAQWNADVASGCMEQGPLPRLRVSISQYKSVCKLADDLGMHVTEFYGGMLIRL